MTEYSKGMTNCMGSLSGLSENELEMLIKEATKEISRRKDRQRREDITNAIAAIQKLAKHYSYLTIKSFVEEEDESDVLFLEIEAALKNLL